MKSQLNVLLVEDDEVDAMTVKRALRELGSSGPLSHVTDGEEALAFLRDHGHPYPDLILLDLNMPRMNGIEFLSAVKEDPQLKPIPVVVLTTSESDVDRMNSFGRCAAGYMVKPVNYAQFVEVMRTIRDYWMTSESPFN